MVSVKLLDATGPGEISGEARLTIIEVTYSSGRPETYLLPLGLATGAEADRIAREELTRVIALDSKGSA